MAPRSIAYSEVMEHRGLRRDIVQPQDHGAEWSPTLGREKPHGLGALIALLSLGLLIALAGAHDLYVAWTEDCLVGTEVQRCTPGQGRVMFGLGVSIVLASIITIVIWLARKR